MNRKILYRGKTLNGEWVYGLPCGTDKNGDINTLLIENTQQKIDVIPETVGQFTGRLDNHINEIFEGDILRLTSRLFNYVIKVVYDNDECRFIGEKADGMWAEFACLGNVEVIGNIYDNPELMNTAMGKQ